MSKICICDCDCMHTNILAQKTINLTLTAGLHEAVCILTLIYKICCQVAPAGFPNDVLFMHNNILRAIQVSMHERWFAVKNQQTAALKTKSLRKELW